MAAKKNAPTGEFVLKSKVKEAISGGGCNSSSDVFDGLNSVVAWYIGQAVARAKANGRKTVRAHDFVAGE